MQLRNVKTTLARRRRGWLVPAACLWSIGLVCLLVGDTRAADEAPDEALLQMIVELVSDSDRDMRALGLQRVREEAPGEAATKRFVELLPKLPPDAQAGLLEALGERGDAVARPTVGTMAFHADTASGDNVHPHSKGRTCLIGIGMPCPFRR